MNPDKLYNHLVDVGNILKMIQSAIPERIPRTVLDNNDEFISAFEQVRAALSSAPQPEIERLMALSGQFRGYGQPQASPQPQQSSASVSPVNSQPLGSIWPDGYKL